MNKKKWISTSVTLSISALLFGLVFASTSINKIRIGKSQECQHESVEYYLEMEPAETMKGHVAHYACCECHTAWSDGFLTNVIGNTLTDRSRLDFFNITYRGIQSATDVLETRIFNDELLEPTRDGYIFDRWVDADGNTVTTVTVNNMELTAKWIVGDVIDGDYAYLLYPDEQVATISKYVGTGATVNIPSEVTIDGITYVINCIGGGAFESTSITTVIMPNTIKTIKGRAFFGCTQLRAISLSNTLESMDYYVFYNCSQLSSVDLPDTLRNIGRAAFNNCPAATLTNNSYLVDGWIVKHAYTSAWSESSLYVDYGPIGIAEEVFTNFYNAKTLSISSTIKYICANNFTGFSNIKTLTIPNSVEIYNSNISGTTSLETINIGTGLRVFNCHNVAFTPTRNVTVAAANQYFKAEDNILYSKDGKKLIYFPPDHLHSNNADVYVVSGVETIGSYAFSNQNTIYGRLWLPDSVTMIEPYGVSYIRNSAVVKCVTEDTWSAYTDAACTNLYKDDVLATELVSYQTYYLKRNVA